jgi:hypothetical protein
MTPFEIGAPPRPFCDASRFIQRRMPGRAALRSTRAVPEETAIAFSYEGAAYAVMMATPADLTDFAIGFSLTERIIRSPCDVETLETVSTADGIMLRMSLGHRPAAAYWERRRRLAGPSGCGLCGLESLADAMRAPPPVTGGARLSRKEIFDAMAALPDWQPMNRATGALHAAARRPRRHFGGRRRRPADQPCVRRDDPESRHSRRAGPGGCVCADRAGRAGCGDRRHHPGRGRAAGRLRDFYPRGPASRWGVRTSRGRRLDDFSCRLLTGSLFVPISRRRQIEERGGGILLQRALQMQQNGRRAEAAGEVRPPAKTCRCRLSWAWA